MHYVVIFLNVNLIFIYERGFLDKSVKNVVKILKETRMRAYGRGFKKRRLKKIKIRNLIVNRRVCHNGYTWN